MQAAHGAGTAQDPLRGWVRRSWGGVIFDILAADRDALEDKVCEATLGLVQRGLDIWMIVRYAKWVEQEEKSVGNAGLIRSRDTRPLGC
jgi:hypothetical protein